MRKYGTAIHLGTDIFSWCLLIETNTFTTNPCERAAIKPINSHATQSMDSSSKSSRLGYHGLKKSPQARRSCIGMFTASLPASSREFGPPRGLWSTVDEALAANALGVSTQTLIPAQQVEYLPGLTVSPSTLEAF